MKTNYKNIARALVFSTAMALIASSCEVTDLKPAYALPESEVFTNADRVEAAVVGMYNAAQSGTYLGNQIRGYPFGAAAIEQSDMRGEDMYNHQLFYEITYTNAHTPTTANNVWMWNTLYRLINRANYIIEGVEAAKLKNTLTEEVANNYIGEALAMRAMAHHELVTLFSRPYSSNPQQNMGVPYRTVAITDGTRVPDAMKIGRGTVAETYTKILEDLNRAETLLLATGKSTRLTKGAAIALKSRVKLHMKDWQGVIDEYNKLKAITRFGLESAPDAPFKSVSSKEMIFALDNSDASNPGVNGALASMYGSPGLGGRGLVKISPVAWKADFWLTDDTRRSLLATRYESGSFAGYYTTKYNKYSTLADPTPLIRYAEVVLNAAEAQARLNQPALALELLNSVRNRALANPTTQAYTIADFVVSGSLLQAIFNERRIEFLAEGLRWEDIHRLSGEGLMEGVPSKANTRSIDKLAFYETTAVTAAHSLPFADYRFVWPLPIDELLNNEVLAAQQNPEY